MESIKKFMRDENGATAIEYGLVAFLIGVAIIPAVSVIAPKLGITFGKVGDDL